MLNSKFNICSTEWLDIVFEKRNKSYGAYDLRKHKGDNMLKAFAIVIFSLSVILGSSYLFSQKKVSADIKKPAKLNDKVIDVVNRDIKETHDRVTFNTPQPKPAIKEQAGIKHASADPVKVTAPVGQKIAATSGEQSLPVNINQPAEPDMLGVKPAPVGGVQSWTDFLEKNLRYPEEAKQNHISGKVWVNFIVERDGRISNIEIEKSAGHGFDEEAVRVISMAPAWAPGIQNGQPVRVKYSLPINFHIER